MKRIIFWFILITLGLSLADLSGQVLYRLIKGRFTWETYEQYKFGLFNIRPFTEFVEDDRLVTMKKNFIAKVDGWEVKTDANRFRIGENKYFSDKENFVFLGDSVPFGWGVDGDKNVPSKFYELIKGLSGKKYGVINAAIPSHSLYQAVKRYQFEVDGKFSVKYVILQIYDPATQFAIWGRKWDKKRCFTSKDTLASFKDMVKMHSRFERFMHKYSSIYHSLYSFVLKIREKREALPISLDLNDSESFDFFEQENNSVLEELNRMFIKNNITLIILPVNTVKALSDFRGQELASLPSGYKTRLVVIDALNQILKKFASSHKNIYYFDVHAYFNKIGKDRFFIDSCHLTEEGAQRQAEFIMGQLKNNNLL